MSDNYADNGGYKPLRLPATGEELLSGRQYYLSPVSRVCIEETYGLRNVPAIVECVFAKRPQTSIVTIRTNMDTGEVVERAPVVLERQHETFRAFIKRGSVMRFTVDIARVRELEPFYVEADRVSDYEKTDEHAPKKVDKTPDLSILDL